MRNLFVAFFSTVDLDYAILMQPRELLSCWNGTADAGSKTYLYFVIKELHLGDKIFFNSAF